EDELLARDRSRQNRLERALCALTGDGVGRQGRRHEDRDAEEVQQLVRVANLAGHAGGRQEDRDQRLGEEHERKDGDRAKDRAIAPVFAELLPGDRQDPTTTDVAEPADAANDRDHRFAASTSSSTSSRYTSCSERRDSAIDRTSAPAA